jgi:hypothetical protein
MHRARTAAAALAAAGIVTATAACSGTVSTPAASTSAAAGTAAPTGWTQPRHISTIEWFASPADICRVYATLAALSRQPGLAPAASILAINNGSLNPDPRQWSTVWFKGGSEPGVLTLNYLATTRTGQSYVVSALAANPSAPIPATATAQLIGAIKGAFTLAAG